VTLLDSNSHVIPRQWEMSAFAHERYDAAIRQLVVARLFATPN
jgi:hypothetical protein